VDWFIYALILATTGSILSVSLTEINVTARQFYFGLALMICVFLLCIYCLAQGILDL
jgi:hypothetical protein